MMNSPTALGHLDPKLATVPKIWKLHVILPFHPLMTHHFPQNKCFNYWIYDIFFRLTVGKTMSQNVTKTTHVPGNGHLIPPLEMLKKPPIFLGMVT